VLLLQGRKLPVTLPCTLLIDAPKPQRLSPVKALDYYMERNTYRDWVWLKGIAVAILHWLGWVTVSGELCNGVPGSKIP